jgi:hypothetical protein
MTCSEMSTGEAAMGSHLDGLKLQPSMSILGARVAQTSDSSPASYAHGAVGNSC